MIYYKVRLDARMDGCVRGWDGWLDGTDELMNERTNGLVNN